MADSGLWRMEVVALNWGDVDLTSGLVTVKRGKYQKARSAVIGATTRRGLPAYRRTFKDCTEFAPMFQAKGGITKKLEPVVALHQPLLKDFLTRF
jgi:site-specific recombinase XerD